MSIYKKSLAPKFFRIIILKFWLSSHQTYQKDSYVLLKRPSKCEALTWRVSPSRDFLRHTCANYLRSICFVIGPWILILYSSYPTQEHSSPFPTKCDRIRFCCSDPSRRYVHNSMQLLGVENSVHFPD